MFIYEKLLQEFTLISKEGSYTSKLRKAWELLQLQAIQSIKVYDQHYLKGIVADIQQHSVVIDLSNFKTSSCTCEGGVFCSHMAALFLAYSTTLDNGTELCKQAFFKLLGIVQATAKVASESSQAVKSDIGAKQVFDHFEKNYSDEWRKCKHSFHPLSQTLTNLKGIAKHKPYEEQRYYWCAAILYAISLGERAVLAVDSFSRYYFEISFKRLIEPWVQSLQEMINGIEVQESYTEEEIIWLSELLNFSIEQIEKYSRSTFEWDYFAYRLVKYSQQSASFKSNMTNQIERLLGDGQPTIVKSVGYGLEAMRYIANYEDDKAIECIKVAQFDKVQRIIYPVIERRIHLKNWDAVTKWMDFLSDYFAKSVHFKSVGPFLQLCQKAALAQPTEKKWSNYLVMYLPHSYHILSENYLKVQDYKGWANLQIYMGRKPEDFKGIELQQIEKVSPTFLVPMYHQAIDQLIEARNRQSYRVAVKHLKKLKSLYSDIGKDQSWSRYINQLNNKFARLRAFQEELLKGKIM